MLNYDRVCPGAQTISTDLCKDSIFWNLEFSPSKNQPNLITLTTEVSETSTLIWSEKRFIYGGFLKWRYLYPKSPWVSIRKSSNDLDDLGIFRVITAMIESSPSSDLQRSSYFVWRLRNPSGVAGSSPFWM